MNVCYVICSIIKIAYLECDPGQSEFTPSGCVSLHLVSEPVLGTHCDCQWSTHITPVSNPVMVRWLMMTYLLSTDVFVGPGRALGRVCMTILERNADLDIYHD